MPVSRTSKRDVGAASGADRDSTRSDDPPRSVNLIALPTRLSKHLLEPLRVGDDPIGHSRLEVEHAATDALRSALARNSAITASASACSDIGASVEVQLAGLDLRMIEHVVEDRHQRRARRRRRSHQTPLLGVERRMAQQVERAQHAVHRRADLVAHRREELRLRHVGRLGRLLGALQRAVRRVGLEAVPDRADGGVAELPRGAKHRQAEYRDQEGQRQRFHAFAEEPHGDQSAQLEHREKRKDCRQGHEERGDRDRSTDVTRRCRPSSPAVQVTDRWEAADQPHQSGQGGVRLEVCSVPDTDL